jgi:hypothetical protein
MILLIPLSSAMVMASPCSCTVGTLDSSLVISISLMAAAAPLDLTPNALKTASLPTQQAANDEDGDGWDWQ